MLSSSPAADRTDDRAPAPSSAAATDMGRANRGRDTMPEVRLRSALHRRGLRYRVNRRPEHALRATADIVFTSVRVAVFVDGCFWHRCPIHGTAPKANGDWWRSKLDENVSRDRRTDRALADRGWLVIRVWEHENPELAADMIMSTVRARRMQTINRI
jgi:DNA mismatch endonuclease, patch repair protein